MEDTALNILKQYGIFGFIVLAITIGGGFMIHKVITYFMAAIEYRDKQLERITDKFSNGMGEQTKVLTKLSGDYDTFIRDFDKFQSEISENNRRILTLINGKDCKTGRYQDA